MKRILLALLLAFPLAVGADHNQQLFSGTPEFSIQINGVSRHNGDCSGPCNENNAGFGFELRETISKWTTTLTAGTFKNSINRQSFYLGAAKTYRWGAEYAAEIGVFGGLLSYAIQLSASEQQQGKRDKILAPILMPIVVFDLNYSRLNLLYLPSFSDDITAAWFLQIGVPLN